MTSVMGKSNMAWQSNYTKLFIDGVWVAPATTEVIEVVSPATEAVCAQVPAASNSDVDRAVEVARCAFEEGPRPRQLLPERIEALGRLSVAISARLEDLAQTITAEMGCPITQSRKIQAARAKDRLGPRQGREGDRDRERLPIRAQRCGIQLRSEARTAAGQPDRHRDGRDPRSIRGDAITRRRIQERGIGREGGLECFDAYVETRSISLPRDLVSAESVKS